jgi:predicted alpha/beta-fold hydrolase
MSLPFDLRSIDKQTFFPRWEMAPALRKPGPSSSHSAQHLVVFVHGLWGNPSHLNYLVKALQDQYTEDRLVVLAAKRNLGSLTYDGVEVGGERVAREIEEFVQELRSSGRTISRFSIVGYSLGGLVARYAIGLLYHRRFFEDVQPINFCTFATPHLGVRTPLLGFPNQIWK